MLTIVLDPCRPDNLMYRMLCSGVSYYIAVCTHCQSLLEMVSMFTDYTADVYVTGVHPIDISSVISDFLAVKHLTLVPVLSYWP